MVRRLGKIRLKLGEGPVWDEIRKVLYYVDIEGKEIGCLDPETEKHTVLKTEKMPGCIVQDGEGYLIAAEEDRLVRISPDTGERKTLIVSNIPEGLRFNDGKCDCMGRLWVGTMAVDQSAPYAKNCGALYRYEKRESGIREEKVFDGMSIPNGIAFAPDNRTMYHIDTPTREITAYTFNSGTGTLSEKRTAVRIGCAGNPDGMTIDGEGMLWTALWGGFAVARYNPETGKLLQLVDLPDKNVSCCTFGGQEKDILYITTAMDEEGRGGYLYEWKAGVKGSVSCLFGCRIQKDGNERREKWERRQ